MTDHDDFQDAASVTILTASYRARCTAPGCANLARAGRKPTSCCSTAISVSSKVPPGPAAPPLVNVMRDPQANNATRDNCQSCHP